MANYPSPCKKMQEKIMQLYDLPTVADAVQVPAEADKCLCQEGAAGLLRKAA